MLWQQIAAAAQAGYPEEVCGILIGRDLAGGRRVDEIQPVANAASPEQKSHRFAISAEQLLRAERLATKEGKLVLGFYHSHPDSPPKPSAVDREHAWPFYSYLILTVSNGLAGEGLSWQLDYDAGEFVSQVVVFV